MGYGGKYDIQTGDLPVKLVAKRLSFTLDFDAILDSNYDRVIGEIKSAKSIAFDTETTGLDFLKDSVVGFSISIEGGKSYYCFIEHDNKKVCLGREKSDEMIKSIFQCSTVFLYNARFDIRMVKMRMSIDISLANIVDSQALVHLVDTNNKMPSLKDSSLQFLGIEQPTFEDMMGGDKNADIRLVDAKVLAYYGSMDAYCTLHLGLLLYNVLKAKYPFIVDLDKSLIRVLENWEQTEFTLDYEHLVRVRDEVLAEIKIIKSMIVKKYGDINLGSTVQVVKVLMQLGLDTGEKTPTGKMKCGAAELEKLIGHPFVDALLSYRKLSKLLTTYVSTLLFRCEQDNPSHFYYKLGDAPTYRLACGSFDPGRTKKFYNIGYFTRMNFQAIPKDDSLERWVKLDSKTMQFDIRDGEGYDKHGYVLAEMKDTNHSVRKAFTVPDGYVWLSGDFSGQEVRLAANYSGESVWIDAFLNGEDIHKRTAISIWGEENYNKDYRKKAKAIVFGILYGGTAYLLQHRLGISEAEANDFLNKFKKGLPVLNQWIDRTIRGARVTGTVTNAFGLPRRLSFYYRGDRSLQGFADRTAVNTLIQGTAGVMIRLAMVRMHKLINKKYKDTVLFRGSVHDELNFAVRRDLVAEFMKDQQGIMVSCVPNNWKVPMTVGFEIGNNWGDLYPVKLSLDGVISVDGV
jgi:DNA polymerase I